MYFLRAKYGNKQQNNKIKVPEEADKTRSAPGRLSIDAAGRKTLNKTIPTLRDDEKILFHTRRPPPPPRALRY
jgi:hypothetical protein